MKKHGIIILALVLVCGIVVAEKIEDYIKPEETSPYAVTRYQQHIEAMKDGANPNIGTTTIPDNGIVDNSFVSHMPLVVVDIDDQEIPVTKSFEVIDEAKDEVRVNRTGQDPFVNGNISVIDNGNYENHLYDAPAITSKMKIRYRGNSSINYDKKQYAIKMLDNQGNPSKVDVMGMGENNDWILNISMIDQSLIRNYMAYNLGSAMFPSTPDLRYCEVFFNTAEGYKYQGLYLMMEKIEESTDRVNLKTYTPGDKYVSYLLCRDREDETDVQLDTYGNQSGETYGRLSVLYPEEELLDDYALNYINEDIDKIERILYSDDEKVFSTWPEYLDVDSFVNYFVFNELMGNYDAGNNSTYMYKNGAGKLCMGPLWDYDNAMDNYSSELNNPENISFIYSSYFEQLIKSKLFVDATQARYQEMIKSGYSDEALGEYIDAVSQYIGNAALRDWDRWKNVYGKNSFMDSQTDEEGYEVNRVRDNWGGEIQRLKDFFALKEIYMSDGLAKLEDKVIDMKTTNGVYGAVGMIILLICTIVLVGRRKMIK